MSGSAVSELGREASGGAGAAGADEEFHLVASLSELKRSGRKRPRANDVEDEGMYFTLL